MMRVAKSKLRIVAGMVTPWRSRQLRSLKSWLPVGYGCSLSSPCVAEVRRIVRRLAMNGNRGFANSDSSGPETTRPRLLRVLEPGTQSETRNWKPSLPHHAFQGRAGGGVQFLGHAAREVRL